VSCCYAVSSCQFCQSPTPTVDLLRSATSLRQPEDTYVATRIQFLPRDAMLSSCVCLFVRPSVRSWYCITTTERIELVFGVKASFYLSHTVLYENLGISKNSCTSLWHFVSNSELRQEAQLSPSDRAMRRGS